jgi:hypothetical protein
MSWTKNSVDLIYALRALRISRLINIRTPGEIASIIQTRHSDVAKDAFTHACGTYACCERDIGVAMYG